MGKLTPMKVELRLVKIERVNYLAQIILGMVNQCVRVH